MNLKELVEKAVQLQVGGADERTVKLGDGRLATGLGLDAERNVVVVAEGQPPPHPSVIEDTICGGITRDTLQSCYRLIATDVALHMLCNHVTLTEIGKFRGPFPDQHELAHQEAITTAIDGLPATVTKDRERIPDDQIRLLTSAGRLAIFNFV